MLHEGAFESFYVNSARRSPARFPAEGHLTVSEAPERYPGMENNNALVQGVRRFRTDPAPLRGLGDLRGARVILMNRWLIERLKVVSWDAETGEFVFDRPTRLFLRPEAGSANCRFFVERLPGKPAAAGAWTLDREGGRLWYRPLDGERAAEAEACVPLIRQHLRVMGDPRECHTVRGIVLRNLCFRHADAVEPDNRFLWWDPYRSESEWDRRESTRNFQEINSADPRADTGSLPQAALNVPGSLQFEAAEDCSVEDCEVTRIGFHAVGVGRGCRSLRFVGNHFHDLGAGGLIAEGVGVDGPAGHRTAHLHIADNVIEGTGHIFPAACGVTLVHASRCEIVHNHIHDLSYSGISVGWVWGYSENPSYGHLIEKNRIHDVGVRGELSDMGAIYLLGYQPGTLVRGNYVHDVNRAAYGGWGLYPDEGSSGITFEGNVVARCATGCLHQHYGRQNTYRNNIFAHGEEYLICLAPDDRGLIYDFPPPGTVFECNILLSRDAPVFQDRRCYFQTEQNFVCDLNLYWDEVRKSDTVVLLEQKPPVPTDLPSIHEEDRSYDLEAFHRSDRDGHSVASDPKLADSGKGDFRLAEDSPVHALGFRPIDLSDVGPRR